MSLRTKILASIVGLILLLGSGGTFHARFSLASISRDQLVKRGEAIASEISARSEDLILTNDVFALYELVNTSIVNNDDIRYIFIVGADGEVRAQTFADGLPQGLRDANQVSSDGSSSVKRLPTDEGAVQDVAFPILEGQAGTVRVGLSEEGIADRVDTLTLQLLALTGAILVLGLVMAYVLVTFLTRPLARLSTAARAVGQGDLTQRLALKGQDEVAQLGTAFNAMIEDLARSRAEIEEVSRQIMRQNEELATLNDVAAAVGQSLELETIMERALDKVLTVVEADAGGILLWDQRLKGLAYRAHKGLSRQYVEGVAGLKLGEGIAGRVASDGEPIVIDDIATDPRTTRQVVRQEDIHAFASVPLRAKEQIVGVLNVARRDVRPFEEGDVRLLVAIGHQVGVAVENARLWQELKEKEQARSELLGKVISAQEEERQRIARELHDEMASGLTALLMGLARLEHLTPEVPPLVAETVAGVKRFAGQALDDTRRMILDLRPTVLDDMGLVSAVRLYAQNRFEPLGLALTLEADQMRGRLDSDLEVALFRILQEAINNCARHAKATHVRIRLEQGDDEVRALVEDDGVGFDVWTTLNGKRERTALGLLGMQERVALLGGSLSIDSQPGQGTRVCLTLPRARESQRL